MTTGLINTRSPSLVGFVPSIHGMARLGRAGMNCNRGGLPTWKGFLLP